MALILKLVQVMIYPVLIINIFGGIVSIVWLIILGDFKYIIYGAILIILSIIFLHHILSFSEKITDTSNRFFDNDFTFLGFTIGYLSHIYYMSVLSIWCVVILTYFLNWSNNQTLIPMLIWSYIVATTATDRVSRRYYLEGNDYSQMTGLFLDFAYLFSLLGLLFNYLSIDDIKYVFIIIMATCIVLQSIIVFSDDTI